MNVIQERIFEIFLEIKKICEKNNIKYFAIGGTCIGAVRHKGFIPWDDDLDVAIPIEKFTEFKYFAERELPSFLKIYTCDEVVHYYNIFIKIVDTRTSFIEEQEYEYPDAYKGIFIDVMPIAAIPIEGINREWFYLKRKILSSLNAGRRFPEFNSKNCLMRTVNKFIRKCERRIPFNYFSTKWFRLIQQYPFENAQYVGYVWSKAVKKLTFPKSYFDESVEIEFETTTIACPKEWDLYLKQQFGDYMKLPPESKRKTAHYGVIDLNQSYIEFQRCPELLKTSKKDKELTI